MGGGFTSKPKPQPQKSGAKAWEDDEAQIPQVDPPKPQPIKPSPAIMNKSIKQDYKKHDYPQQPPKYAYEPKPVSYDYENKILDDALEVSGMSGKQTEGQLNEFSKKIKTLNKDVIWLLMSQRIDLAKEELRGNNKSIANIFYLIEKILKDNISGYQDLIKVKTQLFKEIYDGNYNKKLNVLCSNIHELLTSQPLLIEEIKTNSSYPNNHPKTQTPDFFGFGNHDNNVIEPIPEVEKKKKGFDFIKKKNDQLPPNTQPEISQPIVDILGNIPVNSSEKEKPKRQFVFVKKAKDEEIQSTSQKNGIDLISQLGSLSFNNSPTLQTGEVINLETHNLVINNETEKSNAQNNLEEPKKGLDLNLLAQCYDNNPHAQTGNMNYQQPMGMGSTMQYPMNPQQLGLYPMGPMYSQPMYHDPRIAPIGMYPPHVQYQVNQSQYYPMNPYSQQSPNPISFDPNQYNQPQISLQTEKPNDPKKVNQMTPDPFGNLLDLMKK